MCISSLKANRHETQEPLFRSKSKVQKRCMSPGRQSSLSLNVFVIVWSSVDWMRPTHIWGRQFALLSLYLKLISSRKMFTDTPRIIPCGPVELIHKISHHRTLTECRVHMLSGCKSPHCFPTAHSALWHMQFPPVVQDFPNHSGIKKHVHLSIFSVTNNRSRMRVFQSFW